MAGGRPKAITDEIKKDILHRLENGESLTSITKSKEMPDYSTVCRLIQSDEEFCKNYTYSREIGIDKKVLDLEDLCDTAIAADPKLTNAYRLKVDTLKWIVSKQLPKKYGDKIDHNVSGGVQIVYAPKEAEGL